MTYEHIAQQVREMKPRALTPAQFDDVFVVIEYMRDEAVRLHDQNQKWHAELVEKERALTKRERDVGIRMRAVEASIRTRAVSRLRRYFGG